MHLFHSLHILMVTATIGTVAANEPACSRFDYEEKLLAKVVRMEIKVEQMVEEIKKTKDSAMSTTTEIAQRVETVENYTTHLREDIKSVVADTQEKLKATRLAEIPSVPVVAFNVRLSKSVTVSTNGIVIFDTVLLNEGEGYNAATGIFTAPHNGLYYFAAHVCNRGNKPVQYAIIVENNQIATSSQYDNDSVYSCSSVTTVAIVKFAERVWIKSLISSSDIYYDNYRWNSFVGALLNK
ncbi:complement C1q tumor necrosis factor-related protein 2-like [Mercenaria mercenaria]|uniref:complement C1q tumor necrosis factor-related protein 2-like n=1 Tax=Mercenaria mercenaria TaxID=6596 RepID=UPI00234F087D|nr:complement C1q tumor necrosis factor-related protein 2-like [Mercenaria mercenaria]